MDSQGVARFVCCLSCLILLQGMPSLALAQAEAEAAKTVPGNSGALQVELKRLPTAKEFAPAVLKPKTAVRRTEEAAPPVQGSVTSAVDRPANLAPQQIPLGQASSSLSAAPGQKVEHRAVPLPSDSQPNPSIQEIEGIRRQLGGGISESLRGLPGGGQVELEFQQELTRLYQNRTAPDGPALPGVDRRQIPSFGPSSDQRISQNRKPVGFHSNVRLSKKTNSPVDQLRASAKQLDQMAEEFELTEMYEQADSLRSQAQEFRVAAREILAKTEGSGEKAGNQPIRRVDGEPWKLIPRKQPNDKVKPIR